MVFGKFVGWIYRKNRNMSAVDAYVWPLQSLGTLYVGCKTSMGAEAEKSVTKK